MNRRKFGQVLTAIAAGAAVPSSQAVAADRVSMTIAYWYTGGHTAIDNGIGLRMIGPHGQKNDLSDVDLSGFWRMGDEMIEIQNEPSPRPNH